MLLNFLGMIYNSSGIFPYDLYWGYTDPNIITPVKSFMKLPPMVNAIQHFRHNLQL